jgi:hypothetical protein
MSPLVPHTEQGANFPSFNQPEPDQYKPHLLYSVENTIRLHLDGENKEFVIAERPGVVRALAIHDNTLVHAEDYSDYTAQCAILRTETDDIIADRPNYVEALAVYKDKLVDAGAYKEILYTETDDIIAKRRAWVNALAVHDDRLVDAGEYGKFFYTENDEVIAKLSVNVYALASHDNRLAHVENSIEGKNTYGRVFYTKPYQFIAIRYDWINALAVYKGRLIDTGRYSKIYYSDTGERILEADGPILSLLPIDGQTADRLLKLPGVEEIE